jgi:hypothetical protein
MRIVNWGMFLLGVYLILIGLNSTGLFFGLGNWVGILALVAGVLILIENWRR